MGFGKFTRLPKPERRPGLLSWLAKQIAMPLGKDASLVLMDPPGSGTKVPPSATPRVLLVEDSPSHLHLTDLLADKLREEKLHELRAPKILHDEVAPFTGSSTDSVFRMHLSGDIVNSHDLRPQTQADRDALAEAQAKRDRKAAAKEAQKKRQHG